MTTTGWLLLALWVPGMLTGLFRWFLHPLAVLFELRGRGDSPFGDHTLVSIVVPAYNEEVVLAGCVDSILATGRRRLEVVLVNDGSTDGTWDVMQRYADHPRVRLVDKPNGGKGSALNAGIAAASEDAEVFVFVDADGLFTATTIPRLLAAFRHERVGAVCGNDEPVNLDRPLTHLLALMTHVGTGLARRGLALVGALPIVAGNSGAFRADVVRRLGGFRTDTVGEDLELTWRVQFLGYDVEFAPRALVLAEVPSTLVGLWKQRVRWARGLVQTARIHRRRLWAVTRSPFQAYLPINLVSQLVLPLTQLLSLALLPVLLLEGSVLATAWWPLVLGVVVGTGLVSALATTTLALLLDRAWRHVPLLYVLPLWLPFSWLMSVVVVRALWLEARGAANAWNKLDRTGVRSVTVAPAA